ncbi:MAG: hypothetical protein GKR77_06245, partial [Legionellales bacterium]|nr:hypothetical protein [Legionellales bacterium]
MMKYLTSIIGLLGGLSFSVSGYAITWQDLWLTSDQQGQRLLEQQQA